MTYLSRPAVLITGADSPTGLTTARCLSGLDVDIVGVTHNLSAPTCQSAVWDKILFMSPGPDQQIDELLQYGRDRCAPGQSILLFSQDAMVISASRRLDELRRYFIVPIPDRQTVDVLMDKTLFHRWASQHGFSVPQSIVAEGPEVLVESGRAFSYPAILKPMVRTQAWDSRYANQKFFSIDSYQSLLDTLDNEKPFAVSERYVFQQWIPGGDADVLFVLFAIAPDGAILSRVGGQKIWQWPPLGGSTALCKTYSDQALLSEAESIIRQSGVIGLASVEFKRDPDTQILYITEPTVGRNDYQSGIGIQADESPTRALIAHLLGLAAGTAVVSRANPKDMTPPGRVWIDEVSCLRRMRYLGILKSIRPLVRALVFSSQRRLLWGARDDWKPLKQALSALSWGRKKQENLIQFGMDNSL